MSRPGSSREQLDLLAGIPLQPGSLDYAAELRGVLARAIKECPLSRAVIAAQMSELTGEDISVNHLNAWTAESRGPWRFPMEHAAAFEAATSSHALLELLARKRGCRIVIGRDVLTAELGAIEAQKSELKEREQQVRRMLALHRGQR